MTKALWATLFTAAMASSGGAQDFVGPSSVGSSEQLYQYDDQEKWKHGYLKEMPYYHGYHSFKPYNYHHVYSQSQTAAGWGLNPNTPYSHQFWHKYEQAASPGSPMLTRRMPQFPVGAEQVIYSPAISPVVYQNTVPTLQNGAPLYVPVITPQLSESSLNEAQRNELRAYLANPSIQR